MRIISLILVVSFLAPINLNAEDIESVKNKVRGAKFKEVEASLNDVCFTKNELAQVFTVILEQFGTTITTKNFDEAYQCIRALLQKGVDPNLSHYYSDYDEDESPIFYVMYHQYLIFKLKDKFLYAAWAIHSEPFSIADPLGPSIVNDCQKRTLITTQICKLIDLLVDYGANPNWGSDDYILSPLDYACNYMDAPEVIACLLKHGAQPNDFNEDHIFERCNSAEFLKYKELFGTCSFSYLCISYKIHIIKKFLRKIDASNINSLNKAKQQEVERIKGAFRLRLSRLRMARNHLRSYGAQNIPKPLGSRLLKKLGIKEFLGGSLEELYDDLFETCDNVG